MKLLAASLSILLLTGCETQSVKTTPANGTSADSVAKDPKKLDESATPRRDNTTVNMRDKSSTAITPIDQNESKADVEITANIRKRVVGAEMSSNAHNAKIITQNGKVTLRGPVKSEDEKKQIESIAHDVAGVTAVDNQLEVQP